MSLAADANEDPPGLGAVTDTPSLLLQRLLRAAREHLDLEVAFIGEVTDDRRIFRYVDTAPGIDVCRVGDADPLDESYCAHVLSGRLPEFLADPRDHPVAAELAVTTSLPVGTHVSVPITLSTGEVYGTFCCFSTDVRTHVARTDVRSVRMLAELAGERLEAIRAAEREADERREMVYDILDERSPLEVVFQPLLELDTMRVVGLEALSRFPGLERSPEWVFKEAARAGLSVDLELHVTELVLSEFHRIPDPIRLNINVSPDTLYSERFFRMVSGYPPGRLVIEVTEHAVVEDYTAMREASIRLTQLGLWLAIDDVGMGFSGLNRILESEPEELKLDAAVIRDVHLNPVKQALVQAFCSFGQQVGFAVVAEGIETEQELDTLLQVGATLGQGFLLGHPRRLGDVLADL